MTENQQNVVINDKPVTDIGPRVQETAKAVAAKVQGSTEIEPNLDTVTLTSIPVTQQPGTLDQSVEIMSQQTQTESQVTQSAADIKRQTEALMQQVEEVVQEVEAAVQQASTRAQAEQANSDEARVLQKALDQATSSAVLASESGTDLSLTSDYNQWLNAKLRQSLDWLSQADRDKVSIQVLMRSKSAARELVYYLRNDWPLDLSKTYLYEVNTEERSIYRVFYSEFDSLSQGRAQLEQLPESVKVNSPYLHSVYRMQQALL